MIVQYYKHINDININDIPIVLKELNYFFFVKKKKHIVSFYTVNFIKYYNNFEFELCLSHTPLLHWIKSPDFVTRRDLNPIST